MRATGWPLPILVGFGLALASASTGLAQAIYVPGAASPILEKLDTKPELKPDPPAGPKVDPEVRSAVVNPGEVASRAQPLSGDTLRLQQQQTMFRLWGVVAPGMNEFGGYTAMQGLAGLIVGKVVICAPQKTWMGAVQLARCRVEGRDLAKEMVIRGFARDCPRVSGATYYRLEQRAIVDVAGGFKLPYDCIAAF